MIERAISRRWRALPEAVLAAVVPGVVTIAVGLWVMRSPTAFLSYLRGSAELISGYSSAMSRWGSPIELVSALEAACLLMIVLILRGVIALAMARFYALLFAIPLFISFKHGFVRQDDHIVNFFCFVALALALVSLTVSFQEKTARRIVIVGLLFFVIWQDNVGRYSGRARVAQSIGIAPARFLWGALRFRRLQQSLDASIATFPEASRIEPDLVSLIADSPVA